MPDNPGAWLMTTAKHRALDWLRQAALHARKQDELGRDADARGDHVVPDIAEAIADAEGDVIGDDLLRLIFTACHPVLSADARIALTLKLLGGLSTEEIARAFLVPEPTIAQRIVRAKRTLGEAKVPFEVPSGDALHERLASVLEVVYAIFNEGYTGTRGDDWMRPALMQDALRLGRMLAELARDDSEVHGLVALMELQASRAAARVDAKGRPVLLSEQDRTRWDRLLIRRGLAALERARTLAVAARQPLGPYALQAAIAACHARARECRGHRLAGHRGAVRRAGAGHAVAGGATESRGRGGHGVRAGGGAGDRRRVAARRRAARLPVAAQRARRPAGQARPPRRGPRRTDARGRTGPQRPRARAVAGAGARLRQRADAWPRPPLNAAAGSEPPACGRAGPAPTRIAPRFPAIALNPRLAGGNPGIPIRRTAMNRNTTRTVSAALSAVITLAVLHGIGLVADTQSAAYPEMVARAKAREAAKAPISVATAKTEVAPR